MTLCGIVPTSPGVDGVAPSSGAPHGLVANLLVVMALGGLVSACTLETPGVEHPLPDSLASASHAGFVAGADDAPTWTDPEFTTDSLLVTFGAREGPDVDIIGRIGMAKVRGDEIFVLDDQLHTVHVLNMRTQSHQRVGRPGQGPGELAMPRGLALSEGRLLVADERRLIHEYVRADGEWSWTRDYSVPFLPLDICSTGDGLYLLGMSDDTSSIIHRVEQEKVIASFGVAYRSDDAFIRYVTTEGRLACLPEIDGIAWVPARMSEVHMYGTDGALRWIARLPDYKPMGMVEDPQSRSVSMGLTAGLTEMHMLYAMAPVASNLLVQLSLYDSDAVEADAPKTIQTHAIDMVSGAALEIDFPYLGLIELHDGRMALFANDPWPRVDVFAVSEAGRGR